MVIFWGYYEKFVPVVPLVLAWCWTFILAFSAIVLRLHKKRFTPALGLAMVVPILGRFPFTYLGVYMVGALPFSEPGPSLQEVFKQYIPILLMVLTIVLRPQIAVKLREVERESIKAGGKIFYRFALGGLLLDLILTLLQFANMSSGFIILDTIKQAMLIAAVGLYLAGFTLLVWALRHSESVSGDISMVLRLPVLFILLPCVQIIMLLVIPNLIMGYSLESWLYWAAEITWVIAAAWLVID
jgi:hypothetical protein